LYVPKKKFSHSNNTKIKQKTLKILSALGKFLNLNIPTNTGTKEEKIEMDVRVLKMSKINYLKH